jgi:PAS domain S-box-containing protein
MAVFWMVDSFIDGVIYAERGFLSQLLAPMEQELVYRLQAFLFICLFAGYAWRKSAIQDRLKVSLEEALTGLKAERLRAEAILAAMGDAVSVQDTDLKVLYQNQAHKELMGDHVGEYCYAAYHQCDAVCPDCHLLESFTDGLPHRREIRLETDHGIAYREIYTAPLREANGTIIAGIESVRDTTDRKLAELHLRRLLAAVETSMDGIAILTAQAEYLYLNKAHAAIYGYGSPDELIGKSWHVLYDEQERQRLEPLIYEGFEKKGGWRGEATGQKKDGSGFPQEISLSLIDEGGLICVVRDISKRKLREEAIRMLNDNLQQQTLDLQATNRELAAFSYSLSHDLRSPLTRIYMAVQTIDDMYGDSFDETGKRLLHLICAGCESMEEFIKAMLVLFGVTQSEISCCAVDLSALANEILSEVCLRQPERQVECVITPALVAWSDPQLMWILLENLIGNAWKYTSSAERARIEFGTGESNGVPAYFVRDNGVGFCMTEAERLFKPFQRLHNSNEFPGTGIGLATVQRIIERHGGRVWGEGVVDGGATFYFTIGRTEFSAPDPA